ncbi:MAG TPA: hypothetical protein VHS09_17330 [Polyangiaceae bacterium]|nr:hypothetical protein [Polyangiaceae bacterium]
MPPSPLARTPRIAAPPLLFFALFSAGVHGGAFAFVHAHPGRAAPAPVFDATSAPLAGETLEVEPAGAEAADESAEAPRPNEVAPPATTGVTAVAPRAPSPATRALHPAGAPPSAAGAKPTLYGAVGVRFATDLATTFTRAFPQAASADAVWATAPFGSAGTADVTLTLDDAGHLAGDTVTGNPSPALRRGIERTLALLGPRAFTARGPTTKLRVVARVGQDDVHDGLHGDVFALSGGSFSGEVGTAFFALPAVGGGRRIDVELRLLP